MIYAQEIVKALRHARPRDYQNGKWRDNYNDFTGWIDQYWAAKNTWEATVETIANEIFGLDPDLQRKNIFLRLCHEGDETWQSN